MLLHRIAILFACFAIGVATATILQKLAESRRDQNPRLVLLAWVMLAVSITAGVLLIFTE